jgi:hypothetical protein
VLDVLDLFRQSGAFGRHVSQLGFALRLCRLLFCQAIL